MKFGRCDNQNGQNFFVKLFLVKRCFRFCYGGSNF